MADRDRLQTIVCGPPLLGIALAAAAPGGAGHDQTDGLADAGRTVEIEPAGLGSQQIDYRDGKGRGDAKDQSGIASGIPRDCLLPAFQRPALAKGMVAGTG